MVLYFVLNLESVEAIVLRFMLALLFEAAIFTAAAHRGIKQLTVLGALPIMSFLDTQLGLTIISITVTRMLLRLRRQALSDSAGQCSSQEELTAFRAVSGSMNPSETDVADGS
ncbi:uncharacterized protein ARMOST_15485 [Armillaria ostoyae]|uniref:Uncharacterized protein n=1 Tax=Armillaria ostoyae TaxID=47428 RepID=A0A284RTI5_ARMOS|nr:uncharacterized protein ARMOST_15485 [Armillaria ostoyae]